MTFFHENSIAIRNGWGKKEKKVLFSVRFEKGFPSISLITPTVRSDKGWASIEVMVRELKLVFIDISFSFP